MKDVFIGGSVLLATLSSHVMVVVHSQSLPDLTEFGYPYTLDAAESWFTFPPTDNRTLNDSSSRVTNNVATAQACAEICSTSSSNFAMAGSWNSRNNQCWCYDSLEFACLEPCVAEQGVEFSSQPYSASLLCEASYCDYNTDSVYCLVTMAFDASACLTKRETMQLDEPDLSSYGYTYILNAVDGWYLQPPLQQGSSQSSSNVIYNGILSAASCATICAADNAPAGGWNEAYNQCYCYFQLEDNCLEPCIAETGIEFSTTPYTVDNYCPKSYCDADYFYDEQQIYCKQDVDFDADACLARLQSLSESNTHDDENFIVNLTAQGYSYSADLAETGFYFQPPPASDNYLVYDGFLQPTSCAAQCAADNAPAGSWNTRTNTCWCYFDIDTQCLEPCIQEQGVAFGTNDLTQSSKCETSFCDATYFGGVDPDYCAEISYNQTACDTKIELTPTAEPTNSPTSSNHVMHVTTTGATLLVMTMILSM